MRATYPPLLVTKYDLSKYVSAKNSYKMCHTCFPGSGVPSTMPIQGQKGRLQDERVVRGKVGETSGLLILKRNRVHMRQCHIFSISTLTVRQQTMLAVQ